MSLEENKVCGKTYESHKEFMSKDKHLHLGHKHWIPYFRKACKGQNPVPLNFCKILPVLLLVAKTDNLTSKVAVMSFWY